MNDLIATKQKLSGGFSDAIKETYGDIDFTELVVKAGNVLGYTNHPTMALMLLESVELAIGRKEMPIRRVRKRQAK